jgi:hypothetical protein
MTMNCCLENKMWSGCKQGRDCPARLTERDLDRSIAMSQMPGAVDPRSTGLQYSYGTPPRRPRLPTTSTGIVIGGAHTPQLSTDKACSLERPSFSWRWASTGFALAAAVVGLVAILING